MTVSHQSEEMFDEPQHDWVAAQPLTPILILTANPNLNPNPNPNPNQVAAQLRSTRDARTATPFTEWLWGGMQHQL